MVEVSFSFFVHLFGVCFVLFLCFVVFMFLVGRIKVKFDSPLVAHIALHDAAFLFVTQDLTCHEIYYGNGCIRSEVSQKVRHVAQEIAKQTSMNEFQMYLQEHGFVNEDGRIRKRHVHSYLGKVLYNYLTENGLYAMS